MPHLWVVGRGPLFAGVRRPSSAPSTAVSCRP